jgi:hypothetical protein
LIVRRPAAHITLNGRIRRQLAAHRTALLVLAALVPLLLISGDWKADPDSVNYLSMARSLAAHHGMCRLSSPQWYYAPLYPVLISPAFWTGARPFWVISVINIVTAMILIIGVYHWFRRYSKSGAILVTALVAVNIGLWDVCREPRADTAFAAALIWAAVAITSAMNARSIGRVICWTILGTILLMAACLTRQVGIFLAGGVIVSALCEALRHKCSVRQIIIAVITAVASVAVVIVLMIHEHRTTGAAGVGAITYLDQFRQHDVSLISQLADGLRRQLADFGRLLIPGMWGSFAHQGQWLNINTVVYTLFAIPVIIGWWRFARRTNDPLAWTLPLYGVMFIVWPFDQGTRFTVPLLPVLWGSIWFLLKPWRRRRVGILATVLVLHLAVSVGYLIHDATIVHRQNRDWAAMAGLAGEVTDQQPVAEIGLPQHQWLMLTFLLDRRIAQIETKKRGTDSDVEWVFAPKTDRPINGFTRTESAGETQLWHR